MPIHGFDTDDEPAATAALVLYVVYRSRDKARLKVTPDLWARVERALKDASKRAKTLPDLIEALKSPRRLCAPTLHPRHMQVGLAGDIPLAVFHNPDGTFSHAIRFADDRDTGRREFMVRVVERADARAVLARAHRNTAWVVALVRHRIEGERAVEQRLDAAVDADVETEGVAA